MTRSISWLPATGEATRLLIVRHGQTRMSAQRRYSGRGDVELTEVGQQQASAVAKRLAGRDDVAQSVPVVASPLARTKQTAEAITDAVGGELMFHDGLLELDFGAWEGQTFQEVADTDADRHRKWLSDPTVAAPGGESQDEVYQRVRATCDELVRTYVGRTVVVVSHVTPIKSLLRIGLDCGPALYYRLHLDLASLSIVEFYPDGHASVRLINDSAHLS